jgi:hypothetical protein
MKAAFNDGLFALCLNILILVNLKLCQMKLIEAHSLPFQITMKAAFNDGLFALCLNILILVNLKLCQMKLIEAHSLPFQITWKVAEWRKVL